MRFSITLLSAGLLATVGQAHSATQMEIDILQPWKEAGLLNQDGFPTKTKVDPSKSQFEETQQFLKPWLKHGLVFPDGRVAWPNTEGEKTPARIKHVVQTINSWPSRKNGKFSPLSKALFRKKIEEIKLKGNTTHWSFHKGWKQLPRPTNVSQEKQPEQTQKVVNTTRTWLLHKGWPQPPNVSLNTTRVANATKTAPPTSKTLFHKGKGFFRNKTHRIHFASKPAAVKRDTEINREPFQPLENVSWKKADEKASLDDIRLLENDVEFFEDFLDQLYALYDIQQTAASTGAAPATKTKPWWPAGLGINSEEELEGMIETAKKQYKTALARLGAAIEKGAAATTTKPTAPKPTGARGKSGSSQHKAWVKEQVLRKTGFKTVTRAYTKQATTVASAIPTKPGHFLSQRPHAWATKAPVSATPDKSPYHKTSRRPRVTARDGSVEATATPTTSATAIPKPTAVKDVPEIDDDDFGGCPVCDPPKSTRDIHPPAEKPVVDDEQCLLCEPRQTPAKKPDDWEGPWPPLDDPRVCNWRPGRDPYDCGRWKKDDIINEKRDVDENNNDDDEKPKCMLCGPRKTPAKKPADWEGPWPPLDDPRVCNWHGNQDPYDCGHGKNHGFLNSDSRWRKQDKRDADDGGVVVEGPAEAPYCVWKPGQTKPAPGCGCGAPPIDDDDFGRGDE